MPQNSAPAGAPAFLRVHRPSTVDLIATELRNAVYSGGLPVGSPLREVEISRQLGVSRSPLREAAQRLVQEGLLTADRLGVGVAMGLAMIVGVYVGRQILPRLSRERFVHLVLAMLVLFGVKFLVW